MKKAFTLIELILVMVILGIVAYVASGLIAKTYIAYNQTNSINRANLKVENALSFIANRLEYAIANTIIKRKSATDTTFAPINAAPNDYGVLEWIGYDKDSFEATIPPGWSGFCDIKRSSLENIITPGSNLSLADTIIKNLSGGRSSLSEESVALFFPGSYDYKTIGFNGSTFLGEVIPFNKTGVTIIQGYTRGSAIDGYLNAAFRVSNPKKRITEQYKLAFSAYAVVPVNCRNNLCDLEFRYNYRPWLEETYNGNKAEKSLLINNVSVFKTYATQNRVHIKLCVQDKYLGAKTISICKEKVVYK